MDIINILIGSFASFIALFISTKLIGNKQMSELNLFDYINGITIGSIAAEMATDLEHSPFLPIIAIAVYTMLVMLFNFVSRKSIKFRRILSGRCIILMQNDKIFRENFKKGRLDISEFMTQCRINGFFNINDIETAVLEQNGHISFMPKAGVRPVSPEDLNIAVKKETPDIVVIEDGVILKENLKMTGNNENWLEQNLKNLGIKSAEEIFIAVCSTAQNEFFAYKKDEKAPQNDISQ